MKVSPTCTKTESYYTEYNYFIHTGFHPSVERGRYAGRDTQDAERPSGFGLHLK